MTEIEIRAVVDRLEAAWAARDAAAWGAQFTQDADFTTWFGAHLSGREAIAASHSTVFDQIYADSLGAFDIASIRTPAPDLAIVLLAGWVYNRDAARPTDDPEVAPLAVLRKVDGRWLIEAFQNTPRLVPPPHGGNIGALRAALAS